MKTERCTVSAASLMQAAHLLSRGQVVAFPTETVYGLGADALRADAVARIFAAKERPADNPLIAHIAHRDMLHGLVRAVPPQARALMDAFWPGPLTVVLPKGPGVPDNVSAGLDTVAVRMPAHPDALALLRAFGGPIAAPSANRSGRPSPTTAQHVLLDMDGRIPLILDGGPSGFGLESTVVDMTEDPPVLLRPGGITAEMLRTVLPALTIDPSVLGTPTPGARVRSPGMRHRHYAPAAKLTVVRGAHPDVVTAVSSLYDDKLAQGQTGRILCAQAHAGDYGSRAVHVLGDDPAQMASHLYDAFRNADADGASFLLMELPAMEGIGLALVNRLLRASDHDVVDA